MKEITIANIGKTIKSEAAAYEYLESLRWPDKPICPHCEVEGDHYYLNPQGEGRKTRTGRVSERRVWKCREKGCRRQFSVTTGTIFHGSKIPLTTWLYVTFAMCASKNGIAAREIERTYKLTPKTAWFMTQRIREAMRSDSGQLFKSDVAADEAYIGGDPKNRHAAERGERKYGRGTEKVPVVSLVDNKTGEVRSRVINNVNGGTLRSFIRANVDLREATLHTDANTVYARVGEEMAGHYVVNHSEGVYATDKTKGTNQVENFFSQLKRSIDGTHHHLSEEHLHRYLAEFDFRYSTRKMTDTERMLHLITKVKCRLSYKPLVEGAFILP